MYTQKAACLQLSLFSIPQSICHSDRPHVFNCRDWMFLAYSAVPECGFKCRQVLCLVTPRMSSSGPPVFRAHPMRTSPHNKTSSTIHHHIVSVACYISSILETVVLIIYIRMCTTNCMHVHVDNFQSAVICTARIPSAGMQPVVHQIVKRYNPSY